MIKQLLESQRLMFTAQMQAASLPLLRTFDGQSDGDDEDFDLWLERFEERAKLAKWTDETKLCQLRLHLSKVAGQALHKSSYSRAVASLKKRFRSVEIEELKGLEFHHRVQGEESIEQLGMDIQKLGRKAFPSMAGKELDRLLKRRFYQALHTRWQRKLNVPRTDETFEQLFERARMLEQHEKQFSATTAYRSESQTKKKTATPTPPSSQPQKSNQTPGVASAPATAPGPAPLKGLCRDCGESGHWARHCPRRQKRQQEAPG
jgi:hypothetical protein